MRRLDAASSYPGQLTLISGESFASLVAPFTVHKGMPQCCQSPPTHQPRDHELVDTTSNATSGSQDHAGARVQQHDSHLALNTGASTRGLDPTRRMLSLASVPSRVVFIT